MTQNKRKYGEFPQYELEDLVDRSTLAAVVEALVETCNLKAAHLRENWQDDPAAKAWEHSAVILETAQEKLPSWI